MLNAPSNVPERWIGNDGIAGPAKELQGHRHLLTFSDGPRICLGRAIALTEFKVGNSIVKLSFLRLAWAVDCGRG